MPKSLNPELWDERLADLAKYKAAHGHCNVPKRFDENPGLGTWVLKQRFLSRKGKLARDRSERLDRIGFTWEVGSGVNHRLWNQRLGELKQFKRRHGHCRVPQGYAENPALGKWVERQRRFNKEGRLANDRKERLESIGFVLVSDYVVRWDARLAEWKEYKQKYGHGHVPERYAKNPPLGRWVQIQRHSYKNGKLSEERKKLLTSLGFSWNARQPPPGSVSNDSDTGDVAQSVGTIEAEPAEQEGDSMDRERKGRDDKVGGDLPVSRMKEESLPKEPAKSTGGTSLDGNFEEGGGAPVRILLQSSEDQARVKEEYPIILAAKPSPPVGQPEHDEPDYRDLCDKLTTKVFEYKEKIASLKSENQSLKEEVHPTLLSANPSLPVGQNGTDDLDGAFYKDLCDRMTTWFNAHEEKLTSLKRENRSLKGELAQKKSLCQGAGRM